MADSTTTITPAPPPGCSVEGRYWVRIDAYTKILPVTYGYSVFDLSQPYMPEHPNPIMHYRCIEVSDGGCKSVASADDAARRWIARHERKRAAVTSAAPSDRLAAPRTTSSEAAMQKARATLEAGARALMKAQGWEFSGESLIDDAEHNPRSRAFVTQARAVLVAGGKRIPASLIPA